MGAQERHAHNHSVSIAQTPLVFVLWDMHICSFKRPCGCKSEHPTTEAGRRVTRACGNWPRATCRPSSPQLAARKPVPRVDPEGSNMLALHFMLIRTQKARAETLSRDHMSPCPKTPHFAAHENQPDPKPQIGNQGKAEALRDHS